MDSVSTASASASQQQQQGNAIAQILKAQNCPIVQGVLLETNGNIRQVEVDTTPQAQAVQKLLGSFTFLGQFPTEGTVLMIPQQQEPQTKEVLELNPHKLQPPLDNVEVRGNILLLKVADTDEDDDDDNIMDSEEDAIAAAMTKSAQQQEEEEEFFLDYTVDEYKTFAARTDVVCVSPTNSSSDTMDAVPEEEDDDDDDDDDDMENDQEGEEDGASSDDEEDDDDDDDDGEDSFMKILLSQVLQRFQQENGRMPTEEEFNALQHAMSQTMMGAAAAE